MKKILLLVMAAITMEWAFAQNTSFGSGPIVHKGGDTVVYLVGKFQADKNTSIYNILQSLSEFKFNNGRYFIHNGEAVKRIAINGIQYTDLDIDNTIEALPVSMVNTVEISGGSIGLMLCGFGEDPGKLIDISVSKSNINKVCRLLALKQKKRAPSLDELLKKMGAYEVATDGELTYKGKPVTRVKLLDTVEKPKVIYKPDTMLYLVDHYKIPKDSKADGLLKVMEGFDIAIDGSVAHLGETVKKFKINDKIYDSLKLVSILRKIPADAIENIEMIDDYSNLSPLNNFRGEPEKLLNINIQAIKIADINYLLSENNNIIIDGQKHTIIRMDCRDYASALFGSVMDAVNGVTEPDTDDYGDQIPHFLIQPKAGTNTSKATRY